SSMFWVTGGVFLYKIAARVASVGTALFATAYYLFAPMGVYISQGFVPDPLMIMMFLLSLFAIIRYFDQPSKARLIVAAVASGLAVLVKPFCLFAILGAFISLGIWKQAGWKRLINIPFITFLGITFLPLVYYVYGIFAGGLLSRQAEASFLPRLLLTRSYWQGWLLTAVAVVGFTPLIAALISLPILPKGLSRTLLIGLGIGYIVFCLSFSYQIRFGPHYHSQLIIIVALASGSLLTLITNYLRQLSNEWYWWLPVAGALLLATLFNIREIKRILPNSSPSLENVAAAREIGEIVSHSTRVVYVAPFYGMPLEYYGELTGAYWPRSIANTDQALGISRSRSVEERLNALDFAPQYFVITNFDEFSRHHTDLKEFLERNCPLFAKSDK
ncbi:MAG: glycosyltransferase family 39 protein, partial [Nitrososphaera sp.]|nr:glycosyltransferase family 39 protein [Nitrososphaera sp.]